VRIFLLMLVVVLAGCAAPVVSQIDSMAEMRLKPPPALFHLEGRVSVRTPEQTFSGALSWARASDGDTLLLSGPLGQGVAEIRRRAGFAELNMADGKRIVAQSDERLMQRVLGIGLPLDGLSDWLFGRPRPDISFRAGLDGQGRLAWLDQDGWHLEYDRYANIDGRWLPGRIVARQGDELDFRFVADSWKLQ